MPEVKVKQTDSIEYEPVPNAPGTYIKWIFSPQDGAPNFAMRLFKVQKGGYIPEHDHPWEHEILVLKGKGRVKVDGREYEVRKGTALFIPPNSKHEYWADEELHFICIIPNHGVPPHKR